MTNTLNTPTEVLEHAYPVRVRRYALRAAPQAPANFPAATASFANSNSSATFKSGFFRTEGKSRPTVYREGNPAKLARMS